MPSAGSLATRTSRRLSGTPGTSPGSRLPLRLEHLLVIALVHRNDFIRAEALGGVPTARLRHAVMQLIVTQQFHHASGLGRDVADRFQESVFPVSDELRNPANACRYRHDSAGHGL